MSEKKGPWGWKRKILGVSGCLVMLWRCLKEWLRHGVRLLDGLFRAVFQCLWRKVITSSVNRAMNITLIDGTTLESVVCSNRTIVSNTPAFERAPDCSLLTQFAYLVSLVAVPL